MSHQLNHGEIKRYAEHRQTAGLTGSSQPGVRKKLESGKLDGAIRDDGTLDHAEADRLWIQNTMPVPYNVSGKSKVDQLADAGPVTSGTAAEWGLRKLMAEARGKELDIEEREGKLIEVEAVRKTWVALFGEVRAALLGLPTELALRLAEEKDPKRCQKILSDRLDEVLGALPEEFEDSIAA